MTAAPRPFVWLGAVRFPTATAYDITCYDHGFVLDPANDDHLMPLRRARQVRRQHLSDLHGRRWLWSDDERRAWEKR